MRNLLRRQFERHRLLLAGSALVLGGFQFVLAAIVASMDIPAASRELLVLAPPALRAMIERSMIDSPAGMLAFGWNHPITHAVLTLVALTLASRAIAGEVEQGVIELVLAQPLSRSRYLASHVVFALMAIVGVAFTGLAGAILGRAMFGIPPLAVTSAAKLMGSLVLLDLALYGCTLAISSLGREAGRVGAAGALIAVLSYLVNAIAAMWNRAAFLKAYSLHSYYDPRAVLIDGHLSGGSIAVLAATALATIGLSFFVFQRRDLP